MSKSSTPTPHAITATAARRSRTTPGAFAAPAPTHLQVGTAQSQEVLVRQLGVDEGLLGQRRDDVAAVVGLD